jgi:hypothetical protein
MPQPDPHQARQAQALAQTQFLRALLAGGPPPTGFSPELLAQQSSALVRKRRRLVARAAPVFELSLGAEFEPLFNTYARERPLSSVQPRDDARIFARWLNAKRAGRWWGGSNSGADGDFNGGGAGPASQDSKVP